MGGMYESKRGEGMDGIIGADFLEHCWKVCWSMFAFLMYIYIFVPPGT